VMPYTLYGHGSKKLQSTHPDMLAISWSNLPPNCNSLEVSFVRHFEGVPRTSLRNYVSTEKA